MIKINKHSKIWDIHNCLAITLLIISIIKFNIFGVIGLIGYGVLIFYTAICCILNAKQHGFSYSISFYSGTAYYLIFILLTVIKGGFQQIGTSLIQLFLIMLLAFINRNETELKKDLDTLGKIMVVAGFTMSIFSIFISALYTFAPDLVNSLPVSISSEIIRLSGDLRNRMTGFTGNANVTACYCLIGSVFSTYLITTSNNKRWKLFSAFNLLLSIYTIFIATASRTSMLSFFAFNIVFLLLVYISKSNSWKTILKFTIIVFIILLLLTLLAICIPSVKDFLLRNIIRIDSLKTGSGRLAVYKSALEMPKGRRLFGISLPEFTSVWGFRTHNMFLEVLTFAGIVGLIPFLIYILSSFYVSIKNFISTIKNPNMDYSSKAIRCFFVAYIISYFVFGITESAEIDGIQSISFIAQIVFAYSSLLNSRQALK